VNDNVYAPVQRRRIAGELIAVVLMLMVMLVPRARAEDVAPPVPPLPEGAKPEAPGGLVEDWSAHMQSTFIIQGYDRFHSPYQGQNSLAGSTQIRETITATGFLGARLWDGAEVYVDPEAAQGFGLSHTLGVGGFVNGEATKAGAETPKYAMARYFLRQVIGLGGEQEFVAADANQLASRYDISRLTLTLGKLSANDIFDDNDYAHDPRREFLNWSLWESSAWDYPADARGYTYGFAAELNQADWAFRSGWFLMPRDANAKALIPTFYKYFGNVEELELRSEIFERKGKLRLLAFVNRAPMGSYRDAVLLSPDAPDVTATRGTREKYGFAINLQQEIIDDLGAFSRLSWNDGRTESFAFTEVDRSFALGLSLKGGRWARPSDTLGLAGVINGLSTPHRDYLAAGGLGLILGDGQLSYAPERILETYYDFLVLEPLSVALDFQYVDHPGYNRARGPAQVLGLRTHMEF
jgi:high affinity Mn2+ porin